MKTGTPVLAKSTVFMETFIKVLANPAVFMKTFIKVLASVRQNSGIIMSKKEFCQKFTFIRYENR
jgi:hypothetical protein